MIPHEEGASGAGSRTEDEIMSASLEQGALGPENKPSETVTILYTNYRGETAPRRITPIAREWFGSSDWHPEPQWLFTAFDMDKEVFRDFARSGVKAWGQAAVDAALSASAPASGAERMTAGEWSCPQCDCRTYARVDEKKPDGRFGPGPQIRCVECKAVWKNDRPIVPAPDIPPGVPDSVREALAKFLKQFRQAVFAEDHGAPAVLERVRDIAAGSWFDSESTRLLALISTHPAGQSAGTGAEIEAEAEAVWNEGLIASAPHPFKQTGRPSDDMLMGVAGWLKQMRDGADNLGDQLKASAALYAVSVLLAPVSTRTGDEGTEEDDKRSGHTIARDPTEEMMEAGLYHSSADTSFGDVWTIWQAMWDRAVDPTGDPNPARPPGLAFEDILALVQDGRSRRLHSRGLAARISNHIAAARPAAPEAQGAWRSKAADDVLAERRRRVEAEGWTPAHDDGHSLGELGLAAALYALPYDARVGGEPLIEQDHHIGLDMALEIACGWSLKPDTDPRRRLVKSGALILAEIERRDRLPAPPSSSGQGGR